MAVELVTGYSGTEHVSSSDDGARQAGTVGTGMYVLETVEDPLAATLENANTVTVGPGDVLINGRHARLTGSTTFAVPVGTQAMQTSNLLVLRYSVSDDGTEKVEAVTLTGDPAASDPADPALATGSVLDGDSPVDMPLYRVVTTGIESAQPVRLFSTVPPIAELTLGNLPGSLASDQLPVVPVSKGGTGATDAAEARSNLGITPANIGAAASSHNHSAANITSGTLPVAHGGTGATSADAARAALGITKNLWSGTWSSGNITVPGANSFWMFLLFLGSFASPGGYQESAIAIRYDTYGRIKVIGGGHSGSPYVITGQLSITESTFGWSEGVHKAFLNRGGSSSLLPVTRIVGLL